MRGLGDFQRSQMRDTDPRLTELFGHLRRALDTFEQITLRPHQPRTEPRTEPARQEIPPSKSLAIPPDQEKLAYTVKEIRKLVGISTGTIYKVLGSGELKAVKLGHRTLVLTKDLRTGSTRCHQCDDVLLNSSNKSGYFLTTAPSSTK